MDDTPKMDKASLKRRYLLDIDLYEREYGPWMKRAKKVVDRYRDERNAMQEASGMTDARYNILWSNVQTILPAVFARLPQPQVTRRYKDKDPVGRVASLMLERCLQYEVEQYTDYGSAVANAVEDRVLPGRGISWVRYDPVMKEVEVPEGYRVNPETKQLEPKPEPMQYQEGEGEEVQLTDDIDNEGPMKAEVIDYECCPVDYVHWEDFGHNVARTWEEVSIVWRKVPLSRDELIKRFGKEVGNDVSLDQKPESMSEEVLTSPEGESLQKACIYEIWDKKKGCVVWLSRSYPEVLDYKSDPLGLECFFPCPKPIYATTTTGSLIPIPDYCQYQDQAKELDIICERIDGLIKALKVVGLYDATQDSIKRLMLEGVNNMMIPVDTWAAFAEKGGIKGVIDFLPLDQVVGALNAAYLAREQIKQSIYDITGMADIVRGSSNPNETLGAQQIKGQYASMRLKRLQDKVALFATELLRIKAQIICKHFQPQTIVAMSGVAQLSEQDQAVVPQALQLLQRDPMRDFRIEISSDSLLEVDEQQEKQDRMEFVTTVGGFVNQAMAAPPEIAPLLGEVLLFAIRGFKAGKTLEGTFEETIEALKQKAANPQPQVNPEEQRMQMMQQIEEMKIQNQMQLDQAKLQSEQQIESIRMQAEQEREMQRMAMQAQIDQQKAEMEQQSKLIEARMDDQFNRWKAELDAATKIETANIASNTKMIDDATIAASDEISREIKP